MSVKETNGVQGRFSNYYFIKDMAGQQHNTSQALKANQTWIISILPNGSTTTSVCTQ